MKKKMILYILYVCIGLALFGLGVAEVLGAFWSGSGAALMTIGILRLIRMYRYQTDDVYRERMDVETTDERNAFIRGKACSWAVYLFVLILSVAVIVLEICGQELLSLVIAGAVCLMLLLYCICYMILRKKY